MNQYHIRTEAFEGPLDLLLSLIEKRKLLINDIALAEVSNDYLAYLERHEQFPVAETAQFVLVGSTLLLIKSKSLLPVLKLSDEETSSIEDLAQRLKLLEVFKSRGVRLAEQYRTRALYPRQRSKKIVSTFSPMSDATPGGMQAAIGRVIASFPKTKHTLTQTTVKKVVSLEDMMDRLTKRINDGVKVSFRQFAGSAPEGRINLIVSFLAMLELVRQGVIQVEQETGYGEINMQSDVVDVPRYG